jgi:hypothetical protein
MLTVTRRNTDCIVSDGQWKKKEIKHVIEKSSIAFLIESMETDTVIEFGELLDQVQYVSNDIDYDWNVFVNLLNRKTVFHQSEIICKYEDAVSILIQHIDPKEIMQNLKYKIIPNNLPSIIKKMQLSNIYEQLIFYEYIYMNINNSYTTKAWIIIENNYDQILSLMENAYVDICTTTNEESMYDDFCKIQNYYYYDTDKCNILRQFLKIHNNWLLFPDNLDLDLDLDVSDESFYTTNNSITLKNFIDQITVNEIESIKVDTIKFEIKLCDFCHINRLYDNDNENDRLKVEKFIEAIFKKINCENDFLAQDANDISLCQSIDLFVKMMENDSTSITQLNNNIKNKILLFWFKMNSPDHLTRFNSKFVAFPLSTKRIRDIKLSKCIRNILETANMNFTEMGYILAMDRLDLFEIICNKLEFRSIHQSIYKYLSPRIIEYVINKRKKSNNTFTSDPNVKKTERFIINPLNLMYRKNDEIEGVITFLENNGITLELEYDSFLNRHHFAECSYIAVYWDYLRLMQNANVQQMQIIDNIFSLFKYQIANAEIDCLILQTLIDNISDDLMDPILRVKYSSIIEKYMEPLYSDPKFFVTGPDFCEIQSELTKYCVESHGVVNYLASKTAVSDNDDNRRLKNNDNNVNEDNEDMDSSEIIDTDYSQCINNMDNNEDDDEDEHEHDDNENDDDDESY